MESSTFPWLSGLSDEQAYDFLGEVIDAARTSGTHTSFLGRLDALVVSAEPAGTASEDDDGPALGHSPVPREVG